MATDTKGGDKQNATGRQGNVTVEDVDETNDDAPVFDKAATYKESEKENVKGSTIRT